MPPSGQYIGQVREHMAADSLRGSAHEVAQENLPSVWKVDSRFANPLLKPVKERDGTRGYACGRFSITMTLPFFCGVAIQVSTRR